MDSETFVKWLKHFKEHSHSKENEKVVQLLDNHASHRTLDAVNFARSNGIVMFQFLLRQVIKSGHWIELFLALFKTAYNRGWDNWLVSNTVKRITIHEVAAIFGDAYGKCASVDKAVNGFSSTGIYPYNPDILTNEDYAPSLVTGNADPNTSVVSQP